MPNIPEYNSTAAQQGLRIGDGGVEAYQQAGRRVGAFYHEEGQELGGAVSKVGGDLAEAYNRQQATQEISHGAATYAQLFGNLTQQWNDQASNADPNDHSIGGKFQQETLQPALDQFTNSFTTPEGQRWAAERAAGLQQHLTEHIAADMSTRAGDAVVQNVHAMGNSFANTVYQDPTSLDAVLGTIQPSVDGMTHGQGMTADAAAQVKTRLAQNLRTGIVQSGIRGMMDRNPQAGLDALNSGKYAQDLDEQQQAQLRGYANTATRLQTEQGKAADEQQRKASIDQLDAALNQSTMNMLTRASSDGIIRPAPDDVAGLLKIASLPGASLDPSKVRAQLDFVQHQNSLAEKGQRDVTDPHTYDDFRQRMALPGSDPNALTETQIYQAKANGQLSDKDMRFFNEAKSGIARDASRAPMEKAYNQFLSNMKPSITKGSPLAPGLPQENQLFYQFQTDTRAEIDGAIANGAKPADIQKTLLNPRDPSFLGNMLPRYVLNKDQATGYLTGNITGTAPIVVPPVGGGSPRQVNESPADYLKRTTGGQ